MDKVLDLKEIHLNSSSFAVLVSQDTPVEGLDDETIYVITNGDKKLKRSIARLERQIFLDMCNGLSGNNSCVLDWPVEVDIPEYGRVGDLIDKGYNLVMPVAVIDQSEHLFLVGKIDDGGNLEAAVKFFTSDSLKIRMEYCALNALANVEEEKLEAFLDDVFFGEDILPVGIDDVEESFFDDEEKLCFDDEEELCLDDAPTSDLGFIYGIIPVHRKEDDERLDRQRKGKKTEAPNPMAVHGNAAAKAYKKAQNQEYGYKEGREKIKNLSSIVKKMKSEDSVVRQKANEDCAYALGSLEPHEQLRLLMKLMEEVKPSVLKKLANEVADRDKLGHDTNFTFVLRPWSQDMKKHNFSDKFNYCLFLKSTENDTMKPIRMSPFATVIYMLSMIEKCTRNKNEAKLKNNEKAFVDVYTYMFNDYHKETVHKQFECLFRRINSNDGTYRSGRLNEYYNEIENTFCDVFKGTGENYSPFIIKGDTPLAINPEKIELPEKLMMVKIR